MNIDPPSYAQSTRESAERNIEFEIATDSVGRAGVVRVTADPATLTFEDLCRRVVAEGEEYGFLAIKRLLIRVPVARLPHTTVFQCRNGREGRGNGKRLRVRGRQQCVNKHVSRVFKTDIPLEFSNILLSDQPLLHFYNKCFLVSRAATRAQNLSGDDAKPPAYMNEARIDDSGKRIELNDTRMRFCRYVYRDHPLQPYSNLAL